MKRGTLTRTIWRVCRRTPGLVCKSTELYAAVCIELEHLDYCPNPRSVMRIADRLVSQGQLIR